MRPLLWCALLCVLCAAAACEADGASTGSSTGGDDTGVTDTGSSDVAINALGDECASDAACPATPPHLCVFLQSGEPDLGYCSPRCGSDADCADRYTGPSTGELSCFLPSGDNGCTIVCRADADCPDALSCVATGGPVDVCATAR